MANSVKVFLSSKTYADGRSPVILRITVRRRQYKKQIAKVEAQHWDSQACRVRKHPDQVVLNRIITKNLRSAEEYLLECEADGREPSAKAFFAGFTGSETIGQAIRKTVAEMRAQGRYRSADKYETAARRIDEMGEDPPIAKVDVRFLRDFDRHLQKRDNAQNTRAKYLSVLRAVLNRYLQDGLIDRSPFAAFKIRREKTFKVKLTREEFDRLRDAALPPGQALARDVFVFATMQRGLRAFDVLTLTSRNVSGDRLTVTSSKTGKRMDMVLTGHAREILARYAGSGSPYLFPVLTMDPGGAKDDREAYLKHVNARNTGLNNALREAAAKAGIDKRISMHTARHTFSYIAAESGVSMRVLQDLLEHSRLEITEVYVRTLRRSDELDKAVDGLWE